MILTLFIEKKFALSLSGRTVIKRLGKVDVWVS